jgi:hypothetical protein
MGFASSPIVRDDKSKHEGGVKLNSK